MQKYPLGNLGDALLSATDLIYNSNLEGQILKNEYAPPFGTTVSVKIVGTLCCLLALPLLMCKIWLLTAINNIERTRRRARSRKTGWKCPTELFLSDIVTPPSLLRKIKLFWAIIPIFPSLWYC